LLHITLFFLSCIEARPASEPSPAHLHETKYFRLTFKNPFS
jgi:hypothetical protein